MEPASSLQHSWQLSRALRQASLPQEARNAGVERVEIDALHASLILAQAGSVLHHTIHVRSRNLTTVYCGAFGPQKADYATLLAYRSDWQTTNLDGIFTSHAFRRQPKIISLKP
jgi:hypothetical protein